MSVLLPGDRIARLEAEGAWQQALDELAQQLRGGLEVEAERLHLMGRLLQRLTKWTCARRAYLRALSLDPQRPTTLNNLALLELAQLDAEQAEHWLQQGFNQIRLSDDEAELLHATACDLYLFRLQPERALEHVQRQLQRSISVMALANRAICYHRLGRLKQALCDQQQALRLHLSQVAPDLLEYPAPELVGRRVAQLQDTCLLHQLLVNLGVYRLLLQPDDSEGLALLMASQFNEAPHWLNSHFLDTRWQGDFTQDLILWDDQGFGDSIQNLAWLPDAAARCSRLRLWLRPPLMALVEQRMRLPANVHLQQMPDQPDPLPQDVQQLGLFYLPIVLRQWPSPTSCTRAPWLRRVQEPVGSQPPRRVGLVWSAGHHRSPQPERCARERDVPFNQLWSHALRWRQRYGLELISLQLEGHDDPAVATHIDEGLLQVGLQSQDWSATARCLDGLDLVVSVDTSVAHLAGAMGIPCVLLLGAPAEWRWGQLGTTTPLYASMQLARCRQLADWPSALSQADQQLEAILQCGLASRTETSGSCLASEF